MEIEIPFAIIMKMFIFVVLSAVIPSMAFGGVSVLNQIIKGGGSWTVPDGKVLILNQLVRLDNAQNGDGYLIRVVPSGASENEAFAMAAWGTVNQTGTIFTLHFTSGTRFEGQATVSTLLIGRLADEADLFACVPSEFKEVSESDEKVDATLVVDTKRPAKVQVEESTDLQIWKPSEASVTRTNLKQFNIQVAKRGDAKKFVRAKVTARIQTSP